MYKNKIFKKLIPLMLCTAIAVPALPAYAASSEKEEVRLSSEMTYAQNSKINTDPATLYRNTGENAKGITVCVNAGHGTSGGESQRTLCHPDGSPKVTGGSTSSGSTTATSISSGMTFSDGTPEANVTLAAAVILRDTLLENGYNVLMIRENNNTQLDNIARTVLANNYADCHIALHWDSTTSDKGAFYCKVPSVDSYKKMEPVASTWQKSDKFGECLISGLRESGINIFGSGYLEIDLTQTAYSTVPSIDIECGDAASDHSDAKLRALASGLAKGVDLYFAGESVQPKTTPAPAVKAPAAQEGRVNVAIGSKTVTANGETYEIDAAPYIQKSSNSTLVPLRFVSVAVCGGDLENTDSSSNIAWDDPTRTATVKTNDGKEIAFTADSGTMKVNGTPSAMPNGAKAEIKNGRMYIPFRALGEALGVQVDWDKATETASFILSDSAGPTAKPDNNSAEPTAKPDNNSAEPTAKPDNGSTEPTAKPDNNSAEPTAKPDNGSTEIIVEPTVS